MMDWSKCPAVESVPVSRCEEYCLIMGRPHLSCPTCSRR